MGIDVATMCGSQSGTVARTSVSAMGEGPHPSTTPAADLVIERQYPMPSDDDLAVGAQRRLPDFDYADSDAIFFLTIRAARGTAPFSDSKLAKAVVSSLQWLREHRGIKLYAFCLMPDHLHLLLRLGDSGVSLGSLMSSFKSFTTKQCWEKGWRGKLWQDRFYDHVLRRSEDAMSVVQYILENFERKGLVTEWESYPHAGMLDPM